MNPSIRLALCLSLNLINVIKVDLWRAEWAAGQSNLRLGWNCWTDNGRRGLFSDGLRGSDRERLHCLANWAGNLYRRPKPTIAANKLRPKYLIEIEPGWRGSRSHCRARPVCLIDIPDTRHQALLAMQHSLPTEPTSRPTLPTWPTAAISPFCPAMRGPRRSCLQCITQRGPLLPSPQDCCLHCYTGLTGHSTNAFWSLNCPVFWKWATSRSCDQH